MRAERAEAAWLHDQGVRLAEAGAPAAALARFDAAIALHPPHARAHLNRAGALQALDRCQEAAEACSAALAVVPDLYPAHLRRALTLLAVGRWEEALPHLERTHALRRDPRAMGATHPSVARSSRLKLAHDAAQLRRLAGKGVAARPAALHERALADIAWPEDPSAVMALPRRWRARLAPVYNRALHRAPAPAVPGGALSPGLAVAGEIAVVDRLLRREAMASLRSHLLDSTIWHDFEHIGGFVAAYLEDGLACPVLLQIAVELRRALPGLLGPHPLRQGWAFKCLTGAQGIDVHADGGAVSVNFWVTPDGANLQPGAGGLIVHRAPPPAGWTLAGYDADIPRIRDWLANRNGAVEVPYAANRAVVFPARLFHESGPIRFCGGYENHRINVTLLYGGPSAEIDASPSL